MARKSGTKSPSFGTGVATVGQELAPPHSAAFHESMTSRLASNFGYGDCMKQVQTLTVPYAKLSPGLRTTCSAFVLRGSWEQPSAGSCSCRGSSSNIEEKRERVLTGVLRMAWLKNCREG